MKLIPQTQKPYYWLDAVEEFERAILNDPRVRRAATVVPDDFAQDSRSLTHRILRKSHLLLHSPPGRTLQLYDLLLSPLAHDYFLILLGPYARTFVPHFLLPSRRHLYLFDAWPVTHPIVIEMVRGWRISHLFVSSSQAASMLSSSLRECEVTWIPEGIDVASYYYMPYTQKDIDVLAFGTRYSPYHNLILKPITAAGLRYEYQTDPNTLLFPTRQSFIQGLAHAKISICFPGNLRDLVRTGDIETMTLRYLQSMISKCLIVGHAPAEMKQLFSYNPIIEADMNSPADQLIDILENYDTYIPLIERNFVSVVQNHSWDVRWHTIAKLLLT